MSGFLPAKSAFFFRTALSRGSKYYYAVSQIWATAISDISMTKGSGYLVAIVDWFGRKLID